MAAVKRAPKQTSIEQRTADEWVPRIQEMLDNPPAPGEMFDATESWGVTKVDTRVVNEILWKQFRSDHPDDPGLRLVARREKQTNKSTGPKGEKIPATYALLVRLVDRGKMLELENDAAADAARFAR
jgi:hypothetical protein